MEEKPKYESWRETEKMLRETRDPKMKVSLPQLKCLEDSPCSELQAAQQNPRPLIQFET